MALDLVARLRLQDDLSSRMRKVTGELGKAEKQTKSLTDRMGGLKSALAGIGVTVGIGQLAKSIVGIGVGFDSQMAKVRAVSGATDDQFKQLSDTARQLAKDTKFTLIEAGEGMEYLALAGWKTDAIIAAMPGMLNLAAAGALDLGRAADITSDTMQAFGLASDQATHAADVYAYAQANANTSVEQMGEAMKYLAPIANALGWKLEESSAAMMTVADAGIKGSMGGQAFATSLARLAKPTKPMAKAMDKLGMSFFDAKGNMKTLPQVVGEVEKATKKMTQEQRSSLLTTLFGAQAYKHWAVLLEKGSGELQRMTTELENADGAAARMAETMMDNLGGDWNLFIAGAMEAAYVVYEKFQPALRSIVQVSTLIIGKVPAVINVIAKLAKPFIPLAKAVGIAVAAVGSFLALVGTFKLIGMALAFVSGPIWLVIGAITALVLGFQAVYKHSESFRRAIDGVGKSFEAISKIFDGEHKAAKDILEAAGFSSKQVQLIRKFGYSLKDSFGKIEAIFGGVSNILGGRHKDAIDVLSGAGFTKDQIDKVRSFGYGLRDAFKRVSSIFSGLGSMLTGGGSSDFLSALGFSPEMIAKITEFVTGLKTKVGEFVTYLGAKWAELQPSIALLLERFVSLKDTAVNIFTTLWTFLQPIFGALGNAFMIIADIAVVAWTNIIAPAIDFVIGMFQALWKIVGPILELLGATFGITFGALKLVWDTIIKPVAEYLTGAFATAFEAAMPYVDGLSTAFETLGGVISTIADWFRGFTDALAAFKVPAWLSKLGGGGTVKFESSEGGGSGGKSNYHGIDYVPYDGYQARLHKGESVVTAQENRERKKGGSGGGVVITGNEFHVRQDSDIHGIAVELYGLINEAAEAGA